MGFPWILQKYIFREMGKTFLLTAAALTGVLGLGGGVLQMIHLGEVTAWQLLRLMGLVLPVAVALTLPVAALFSAAATYGRLSADNEFTACRSSGINLHFLFLPTIVLSLVSATVTFAFINFLIPGLVRNLAEFAASDAGSMIRQRLNRPKGLTLGGKYRIYADDTSFDIQNQQSISLHRVAFVEVDKETEEWIRYGTARQVNLGFERTESGARASGVMLGLSFYDRRAGRFAEVAQQDIPANEVKNLVPAEIKFLNLLELFHFGADPGAWHQVASKFDHVRTAMARRWTYDTIEADWKPDQRFTLEGSTVRYEVRAARLARLPRDAGLQFTDVTVDEQRDGQRTTYTAKEATLDVTRGDTLEECGVRLEALTVRVGEGDGSVNRAKYSFDPVPLDPAVVKRATAGSLDELLGMKGTDADDVLTQRVVDAREMLGNITRRIAATISERIAFSVSVLFLVILGAVLGIVYRGAHIVVAFGISFVPTLLVIITIVTGRQLACNETTHVAGLALIWSGLIVVAILDGWMLTRVLRR